LRPFSPGPDLSWLLMIQSWVLNAGYFALLVRMDDAMDSITGQDTEESEDVIINKVLDELGLEQEAAMGVVPTGGPAAGVQVGPSDDLMSRLDNATK